MNLRITAVGITLALRQKLLPKVSQLGESELRCGRRLSAPPKSAVSCDKMPIVAYSPSLERDSRQRQSRLVRSRADHYVDAKAALTKHPRAWMDFARGMRPAAT